MLCIGDHIQFLVHNHGRFVAQQQAVFDGFEGGAVNDGGNSIAQMIPIIRMPMRKDFCNYLT